MSKIINILESQQICYLSHTNSYVVGMIPISDKDELDLDKLSEEQKGGYSFIVPNVLGEIHFVIPRSNILLYGDIDMSNNDDVNCLYNKYNDIIGNHNRIRTHVDYKTGDVELINNKVMMSETWDIELWMKYNLLLLGNPKKVMIFKKAK